MATLYVADLDGTLLDANARLSDETVSLLNPLLARGLLFTVATARSPATAVELLRPLALRLPGILLTGCILYDFTQNRILRTRAMGAQPLDAVCTLLETTGQEALAYCVRGGQLYVYYREFSSDFEREFVAPRLGSPYKTFVQTQDYRRSLAGCEVLMFLFCIPDLRTAAACYTLLQGEQGLSSYFYEHEYGGGYLLEVYPACAGKGDGVAALREMTGAGRVVAFGDNVNDLALFDACDEGCAMKNACAPLKERAQHLIGANTEAGVARWIAAREQGELPL